MPTRTIATGRSIASGRTAVSQVAAPTVAIVNSGLMAVLTFTQAIYSQSGTITINADSTGTGTYVAGLGTNVLYYALTSCNPSGDPVLSGTTVTMTASANTWNGSSAAVTGGAVTNSSAYSFSLWFDAARSYSDAGTTLCVNNDLVYQITKSNGQGVNATQTTSGSRPTFKTSIQNGLPCVLGNGTSSFLNISNTAVTDFTLYYVATNVNSGDVFSALVGDINGYYLAAFRRANTRIYSQNTAAQVNNGSSGAYSYGVFNCWTVQHESGTLRIFKDGTQIGGDIAFTSAAFTANCILATTSGGSSWHSGYLGEMMLAPAAVASGTRAQVEAYLKAKWGTP